MVGIDTIAQQGAGIALSGRQKVEDKRHVASIPVSLSAHEPDIALATGRHDKLAHLAL